MLSEALPEALDTETFCISSRRIQDYDAVSCTLVDQTGKATPTAEVLSSSEARTIAIVDRSADIDAAARAIVTSRFSFQGMSPYAPDLVIVNEFVKKDFFQACTHYASQSFASQAITRAANHVSEETRKAIKDAEGKGQLSCFGSSNFMLVDISERYCGPATYLVLINTFQLFSRGKHEDHWSLSSNHYLQQSHRCSLVPKTRVRKALYSQMGSSIDNVN
jgi:hypothetical protein